MDEQQNPVTQEEAAALSKALEVGGTIALEEASKAPTLDPYILFTQIEAMRKEGVDEETIREAFNQIMARPAMRPQVKNSMKRHKDSIPMPTQDEINKMYTQVHEQRVVSPEMESLIQEVENAKNRRVAAERPSFRKFKDAVARKVMVFILRVTIFVFKSLGVR